MLKSQNSGDFNEFYNTFEDLFNNHSEIIDDAVMKDYSESWKRPQVYKDIEKANENEKNNNEYELVYKEIEDNIV